MPEPVPDPYPWLPRQLAAVIGPAPDPAASEKDQILALTAFAEKAALYMLAVGMAAYFDLPADRRSAKVHAGLDGKLRGGPLSFGTVTQLLDVLAGADWATDDVGHPLSRKGWEARFSRVVSDRNDVVHNRRPATTALLAEVGGQLSALRAHLDWLDRLVLIQPLQVRPAGGSYQVTEYRRLDGATAKLSGLLVPPGQCEGMPPRLRLRLAPLLARPDGRRCLNLFPFARFADAVGGPPEVYLLSGVTVSKSVRQTGIREAEFVRAVAEGSETFKPDASDPDSTCQFLGTFLHPVLWPEPVTPSDPLPASPNLSGFGRGWLGVCRDKHPYILEFGDFHGRDDWLDRLDAWAGMPPAVPPTDPVPADAPVLCLYALGGGGKTALANAWVDRAEARLREAGYDGVFWCSFYSPNHDRTRSDLSGEAAQTTPRYDFKQLLIDLLRWLKLEHLPFDPTPAWRAEAERLVLDQLSRGAFVLVLDGLERKMNGFARTAGANTDGQQLDHDIEQKRFTPYQQQMLNRADGRFLVALAKRLNDGRGGLRSRVLVTSRVPPADLCEVPGKLGQPGVEARELAGFSHAEAVRLWKEKGLKVPAGDTLRRQFAAWGHHPLLITLLIERVATAGVRGDYDEWRRRYPTFDPLDLPDRAGSPTTARQRMFELLLADVPDDRWAVLEAVATNPDPLPARLLERILVDRLEVFPTVGDLYSSLDWLYARRLVGRDQTRELYDAHPVIRDFVWTRGRDPAAAAARQQEFLQALTEVADGDPVYIHAAKVRIDLRAGANDRAWRLFDDQLLPVLQAMGQTEPALALVERWFPLRPNGRATALPRLARTADQAAALDALGGLLMSAGVDPERADRSMRYAAAKHLLAGDEEKFLGTRSGRTWGVIYRGGLFQAELELRALAVRAGTGGRPVLAAKAAMWAGLLLAVRGDAAGFDRLAAAVLSVLRPTDRRWTLQGIAEGDTYLGRFDRAVAGIDECRQVPSGEPLPHPGQEAWEELTLGVARAGLGEADLAADPLDRALSYSRNALYPILEAFVLPAEARLAVARRDPTATAACVRLYDDGVDPDGQWRLAAAEVQLAAAEAGLPGKHGPPAERALWLAAGEGEPFVYRRVFDRAAKLVPAAHQPAVLAGTVTRPDNWAEVLPSLDAVLDALGQRPADEAGSEAVARRQVHLLSPTPPGHIQFVFPADDATGVPTDELAEAVATAVAGQPVGADADWWAGFTRLNAPRWVLRVCRELARAGLTVPAFAAAARRTPTSVWAVLVHQARVQGARP